MDDTLARVRSRIEQVTADLTVAQIAGAPTDGWSVAQILEHLALAYRATTRGLERAMASGDLRAPAPSPQQWLARTIVIGLGYFPKVKAPEDAVPKGMPPDAVRGVLRSALVEMDEALGRAASRFGSGTRVVKHPYFGGLTVPQWRRFHLRHTEHHLRQVEERLRRREGPA